MEHNPSDLVNSFCVAADQTVGAAADLRSDSRIDTKSWGFALIGIVSGALGGTSISITPEFFSAPTGGVADSVGAALVHATNSAFSSAEYRLHGVERYMEVRIVGTGGTGGPANVFVQLFRADDRREMAAFTGAKAALGVS